MKDWVEKMAFHLQQIQAFCEKFPTIPKVLIVPAMTVGHEVMVALARAEVSWVNLRIATPIQLAKDDVLPTLIGEGWRPLVQGTDLFLVDALIPEVVKDLEDDYFAQQAPGLARSFMRTVRALRASGMDGLSGDTTSVRHRLLDGLYQAYMAALTQAKVYDNAMVYQRACDEVVEDETQYAILDATPLPKLAFEYVRKKTHGRLCRIGYEQMGVSLPAHCAGVRFEDVDGIGVDEGTVGAGVRLFGEGLRNEDRGVVRLRETLGIETEVRAVLREVREEDIPLDDVEIVYTTENPYLNLVCDVFKRFEVPATFAEGLPVNTTRVGQAMIGFYRWIGSGFLAEEWVWLCRAGLVHFGDDAPTPHAVASLVRVARVGEGRGRYAEALTRMKNRILERDPDGDDAFRGVRVAEVDAVAQVIQRVMDVIPDVPTVTLDEMAVAGLMFLDAFVGGDDLAEEREARETLMGFLTQMQDVDYKGAVRGVASRLAELVNGQVFGAMSAKPGCVTVAPLSLAGYGGRKHTFVVGMDEGAFPGGMSEDPLLLDGERAGLSGELVLQRTRPAEQVWHLARVMAMATGQVTLSSCRRSLADGRERYPSALFQQAAQQMGIDEHDVAVMRALPEDVHVALDDAEGLLAQYPFLDYAGYVGRAYAWLAAGQKAKKAREWAGVTRYDGWLGMATPELAITDQQGVFSPSRLEMLARCPYRYFLNAVLHIRPLEEPEDDPTRWLDPMAFGTLLHTLFKDFMQTVKARGEKPDREKHAALIQALLEKRVEEKKETEPVIHQAAFRADKKRMDQAAQVFLAVESDQEQADPVGFEVSFGFGEAGDLSREDPVTVELAKDVKFQIKGRIDRVDALEDGFAIWDYKTGSMSQYDERDLLKRGTHLQWALYAYALDVVLKQQQKLGGVRESGYVFPGDREHGRKLSAPPPSPADLAQVLRPLFELVANGGFLHLQKSHECTYCAYNRVCGEERIDNNALEDLRATMDDRADFEKILDSLNQWMGV